jgi:signal transduction histidine kinase
VEDAEILQLISNAIGIKLNDGDSEIVIRINVDHLRAELTFADNGIGIDEENLTRVFEMFYRATEQSDGSGIGLYIVKNAVDKLGGQISVASRIGQGTRFNIILPNRINSAISIQPSSVGIEE